VAAPVFAAAMRESLAEGNDRNVLLALADCAWFDGVTWILVGDDKQDEELTICRLARVSRTTVWRSIQALIELGDIQTVRVRRGRSFVTLYRVLHGATDVDYERIPFDLPHRFDEQPPQVERSTLKRSGDGAAASGLDSAVANTGSVERSNLQRSPEASTLQPEAVQRFTGDALNVSSSCAHVKAETEENRKENQQQQGDAAAVALLDDHLRNLGVASPIRQQALAEPDRAKAWLEVAATAATINPAGFFVACFTAGEWPSGRLDKRQTSHVAQLEWIEQTSWCLEAEDAHAIVDDWRDLDDVDRAELHEQVDRTRQQRAESEAA